ncbi:MCE family protein [Nocardioides immobilis]|uniref:MCE family protein n=1 Tax=Nocardioides immobilis TaxID=2049295 RepID=A0A417XZC0_9ACTN|nr:MCE family protein [Nocardioides immobilis]
MNILRRLRRALAAPPVRTGRARIVKLGLSLYVVTAVVIGLLAMKPQITNLLSGGDTITAEFSSQYKLRAHDSSVKMAGITVGKVTDIDGTDDGTALVTMKLDEGIVDKLGSTPTANIEPRTLLGGRYAIELHPGGEGAFAGEIPIQRTSIPVELDTIVEALPADAREALQGLVGNAGPTLSESSDEIPDLLDSAPDVLRPVTPVLESAQGTRPRQDLHGIVSRLDAAARALTRTDGQLDATVTDLATTSSTLARHRDELSTVLAELPATLEQGGDGMNGLADVVTRLETTASSLQPATPELANLLVDLKPTLRIAQPVLRDLVPTLRELRPAVEQLVPVTDQATGILRDLRGPVMARVKGPVMDFLLNPWVGSGPYSRSAEGYQADHKVYQELAYMATNIDRASMGQDSRGSTLAFQAGVGLDSISGVPFSLDNLVNLALDNAGIDDPALRNDVLDNAGVSR